jgi:UPF0716 family protein affecting phage T7 exclusion
MCAAALPFAAVLGAAAVLRLLAAFGVAGVVLLRLLELSVLLAAA